MMRKLVIPALVIALCSLIYFFSEMIKFLLFMLIMMATQHRLLLIIYLPLNPGKLIGGQIIVKKYWINITFHLEITRHS